LALVDMTVVEQRYRAVLAVQRGEQKTDVAAQFGVSRQSVHHWCVRYAADGLAGLVDRSHRPESCPHQTTAEIEVWVCELRREHPGWGAHRIVHELARLARPGVRVPSRNSVHRILVRNGLVDPRRRKRKRADYIRWEREAPMALWQLDIVGGVFLVDGTEAKLVTGVDDHSRFCVIASVVPRATGRAVCLAFVDAMRRYGLPDEVLTDNGKQFTARFGRGGEVLFDRICRDNAITHRLTQPASPTTTGKVERFHQTLRRELLTDHEPFDTVLAAHAAVDTWITEYNLDRPHRALDMAYPVDRFAAGQQDRAASEELLPLRVPAILEPTAATVGPVGIEQAAQFATPAESIREDADAPPVQTVYRGGPVEFERVVPASGTSASPGTVLARPRPRRCHDHLLGRSRAHPSVCHRRADQDRPLAPVVERPGRSRCLWRTARRGLTAATDRTRRDRAGDRPHRVPGRHGVAGRALDRRRGDPRRAPGHHPHRRRYVDVLRPRHPRTAPHPAQPADL
jgi:transposase InsO family protein